MTKTTITYLALGLATANFSSIEKLARLYLSGASSLSSSSTSPQRPSNRSIHSRTIGKEETLRYAGLSKNARNVFFR